MKTKTTIPKTAMRFRKKRFATIAPGERVLTRRSSLKEYFSKSDIFSPPFLINTNSRIYHGVKNVRKKVSNQSQNGDKH